MDELVAEFISEASESLLDLDNELVELEKNPENYDLLSKIFRVMHTIKGTCGFLSLGKLASVAHAGENVLDQMRSKKIPITPHNISIILESIDAIKSIVNYIQTNAKEPDTDYSPLINKINSSINGEVAPIPEAKENIELVSKESGGDIEMTIKQPPQQDTAPSVPAQSSPAEHGEASANQTVRIKVEILDHLMQMVSELVLNRNQLLQIDRVIRNNKLSSFLQSLNTITTSIQETFMETRMQPISNAWIKMPRLVRDLSNELNKKIKLVMVGQDTELDKQLIEAIKDPLMHMVRNSADHGLEKEVDRLASGKPAEGTITLKAYHSSGHIIIEVSDDGYGINIAKVKSKILEKSLATESELNALSDQQVMQYIFRAGFSTADSITSVSGRGVGMDVVKNNIDNIRGSVELQSVMGQGSIFTIKIPLTLAIMSILVVESGKQKFGIPQSNILEMILINEKSKYQIEEIDNHQILRLRESLLLLIKLSEVLQLPENKETRDYYVIICNVNGVSFGLILDNIYDTEEIVLKPVSTVLKSVDVYSGVTLLGNGDIIMILELNGVAKDSLRHDATVVKAAEQEIDEIEILSSFLVVKSGDSYKAIPLELISRLEEIDITKLEHVHGKKVIQYRDSLMYIEPLDSNYKIATSGKQTVIVLSNEEYVIGFAVEKIVEIVNQNIEDKPQENNGSPLVLGGKVTDIIDVNSYFNKLFFILEEPVNPESSLYKILLVEDSPYFRKLFSSLLKSEGFNVISVKNGSEALKIVTQQTFNLIIADYGTIDINKFDNIPIIVLVSNIELSEENKKSGINFISKANHSQLLEVSSSLLKGV